MGKCFDNSHQSERDREPVLGTDPALEGGYLRREKRERLSVIGCGISEGTYKEEDMSELVMGLRLVNQMGALV